jgi:hypothetical protein
LDEPRGGIWRYKFPLLFEELTDAPPALEKVCPGSALSPSVAADAPGDGRGDEFGDEGMRWDFKDA